MALSIRTRFEVFKRDGFTCQYCGRKSPDVVLEVDHISPVSRGGTDDAINLFTSCWECNRGKADVPLLQMVTGEDPHDLAIALLERQRQVEEYNRVMAEERERREGTVWQLHRYWCEEQGLPWTPETMMGRQDYNWLFSALKWCPSEQIKEFMDAAISRHMTKNFRYVAGCARNWRYEHAANQKTEEPAY